MHGDILGIIVAVKLHQEITVFLFLLVRAMFVRWTRLKYRPESPGEGREVLPYISYIGMCRLIG